MGKNLFNQLRQQNDTEKPDNSRPYSFRGGGDSPFRTKRPSSPNTFKAKPRGKEPADREPAYQPPAAREDGHVYEWQPPGAREVMKDLGLRILEVAIAAGVLAIGEEVAYFFKKRRFFTRDQRDRKDW